MCSGHITRYDCGHEKRTYYYQCIDGSNEHRQELLPHRLVGRRFRAGRLCSDCERVRLDREEDENDVRESHEERAKVLLEFFRRERPWPLLDAEVSTTFRSAYSAGDRLHPWLNRGNEPGLDAHRALFAERFPGEGPSLFQEMLDRQVEIDQTSVILEDDMQFRFDALLERCTAESRLRVGAERAELDQVQQRQQAMRDEVRNRVQSLRSRQPFLIQNGGTSQTMQEEERGRFQRVTRSIEQIRELWPALYQPSDIEELTRGLHIPEEIELLRVINQTNADRLQEIARLIEQIRMVHATIEQRTGSVNNMPHESRQGEPQDSEDARGLYNTVERQLDEVLALVGQMLADGNSTPLDNNQAIREIRDEGEANREENRELGDRDQNMEAARLQEPVIQQEPLPTEQSNGLYESDPEWILNFDDWCAENPDTESYIFNDRSPETKLRQDINGWFQHLHTCESQARLDWIPIAQAFRDAILKGDRFHYDFVPDAACIEASEPVTLLSFRNWCLENADPAEIAISPMNYVFIDLLKGYVEYLISAHTWSVLAAFQCDRRGRVQIMRAYLTAIPGAPLSRGLSDTCMMEDTESNRQLCLDIGHLTMEGGLTTDAEIQGRRAQFDRFHNLRREAEAVHTGQLPGFGIERQERATRIRDEQERAREEREAESNFFGLEAAAERIRAELQARNEASDTSDEDSQEESDEGAEWREAPGERVSWPFGSLRRSSPRRFT